MIKDQIEPCAGGSGQETAHVPVMLDEVLDLLNVKPGGRYLDGTVGLGGHALEIMRRAGKSGRLLGLDRDPRALELARQRLAGFEGVRLELSSYSRFPGILDELGWENLDGALLDLGVSSLQLDQAKRGFSFLREGPLDMRMGPAGGEAPASRIVNKASLETLKRIIGQYGQEPMGGRIARAIIEARAKGPIETTLQLAGIVEKAYPPARRAKARNHPATKTFQALRMEVNKELDELAAFLEAVPDYLAPGARVAVISFHSLEDGMVKRAFRDEAKGCRCPREVPVCVCGRKPRLRILTKKPLTPSEEEMEKNSRARSAKLRAAERLQDREQE